jgi:hypothetical protein
MLLTQSKVNECDSFRLLCWKISGKLLTQYMVNKCEVFQTSVLEIWGKALEAADGWYFINF